MRERGSLHAGHGSGARLQECAGQADARSCDADVDEDHPCRRGDAQPGRPRSARALADDVPLSVLLLTGPRPAHPPRRRRALGRASASTRTALVGRHAVRPLPAAAARRWSCRTTRPCSAGETRRFALPYDEGYRDTLVPIRAADGTIAGALALAFDEGEELRAERAGAPGAGAPPRPAGRRRPARGARAAPRAAGGADGRRLPRRRRGPRGRARHLLERADAPA